MLFVPVADKIVRLEGAVNRPMRYEMVAGETVKDLLRYAGGVKYNAYPDYLQIERYSNDEVIYLVYKLDDT